MADTIKDWEKMRQELHLSGADLRALAGHFRAEAEAALAGEKSSLSALHTYLGLPTGRETGTFLALDFGGTNVRASRIRLLGEQGITVESKVAKPLKCADYDYTSSERTAEELFDFIAGLVGEAAGGNQPYKLGFTFSFAVNQTSAKDASLIAWSKEIAVPGVAGRPVNQLLKDALVRAGLDAIEPVALLNDTTATLLSSVYQHNPAQIGIVCGTGFNMCYYEPALSMIVNLEAAGFDGGPATVWDQRVDAASQQPGDHPFEKMIGGRYLSEVYGQVLCDFLGRADVPYFTTREMNELISGVKSAEDILGFAVTAAEAEGMKALGKAVFARAAQLIGAASFGILSHLAGEEAIKEQAIAIEGSLVEKIKGVPALIEDAICVFCMAPTENIRIRVAPNNNGASLGAAIAAALCG
ncbi:hexokinase [uncultured Megasphaera sp.]|uniref:hexokinase n=1 Tax=uncultured Megasphaera sp. TaxID=165188 RepID=UPI0025DD220B|nr:hexokinase [uncultured Megasphaera sp.]